MYIIKRRKKLNHTREKPQSHEFQYAGFTRSKYNIQMPPHLRGAHVITNNVITTSSLVSHRNSSFGFLLSTFSTWPGAPDNLDTNCICLRNYLKPLTCEFSGTLFSIRLQHRPSKNLMRPNGIYSNYLPKLEQSTL